MKITKSELQELVREAIDEYKLINEDTSLNKILSTEEQKEIKTIANQYKKEINNQIKNIDDKDFYIKMSDTYTYKFPGINSITLYFYEQFQQCGLVVYSEDAYDFKNAYRKVYDMLFDKLSKDKVLSKKYNFNNSKKINGIILFQFKDSKRSDSLNKAQSEYERLETKIKTEFNYNDKSKLHNGSDKALINSIKKEINSNEYLSKYQKQKLLRELDMYSELCRRYEARFKNSDGSENKYKKVFDELGKRLKEAGFPSSKKTWWTDGHDYEDDYFFFVAYEEGYSDTGSDYDNGLTKADKAKNEQFVKKLVEIIKQLRSEFKCTIDYDIYRGHGTVTVSFNE